MELNDQVAYVFIMNRIEDIKLGQQRKESDE